MEGNLDLEWKNQVAGGTMEDQNNYRSQNQDKNWNKYLDVTWRCTDIKGVFPQLLLEKICNNIFSNNNSNDDSEEGVEHPATVEADIDSLCTTGSTQIVPETVEEDKSLVHGFGQRRCYSEAKDNSEKSTIRQGGVQLQMTVIVSREDNSPSNHPEVKSKGEVINDSEIFIGNSQSRHATASRKKPHKSFGRGSFLTIASQFQHKLDNLFTLLFCSLLLTAGSAAQPLQDKACYWSNLEDYHRSLWNATDLEYCEGICVNAHEDDNKWFVSDLIEVEGFLEAVCGVCLVLAMIGIILFWKVCTCVYKLFHNRNNIVYVARIADIQLAGADETESDVDSTKSDDDHFQSFFEPVFPVAASTPHVCHKHPLLSKPGQSTPPKVYKNKRRNLSQPTPAWQQLESGITKKCSENSVTGGEITHGLPDQSSECISTETSDNFSSFEETATQNEVFPLPAGIQVSMEEHLPSVAIIVSGKLTKDKNASKLNTVSAALNLNSAPLAPSHPVSSDTIQEFGVAVGSLVMTFGCIVEQGVAMESLEFTETSELGAPNGKYHPIIEGTQPAPFKAACE